MFSRCRSSRCEESRVKNASSLLILVDAFIDCSGAIPKKQSKCVEWCDIKLRLGIEL